MKILFVVAHPDDEVYGPYGTIARMVQEGNEVMVLCLCTGKRPNANQEVSKNRIKTFISNCQNLNVKYELWDNDDLDLTLNETAHKLTKFIDLNKPEIVYTHNISDINHDHQIAAEATMIACRPKPECREYQWNSERQRGSPHRISRSHPGQWRSSSRCQRH